jgi:hypothetical protein
MGSPSSRESDASFDVEAVRRDVMQGFVSISRAAEEYGVVIGATTTLEVDTEATGRLRNRKREIRAA